MPQNDRAGKLGRDFAVDDNGLPLYRRNERGEEKGLRL